MSIISEALKKTEEQRSSRPAAASFPKPRRGAGWAVLIFLLVAMAPFALPRVCRSLNAEPPLTADGAAPASEAEARTQEAGAVAEPEEIGNPQIAIETQRIAAASVTQAMAGYRLSGIVQGTDGYHAIINEQVLGKGGLLADGARVSKITEQMVVLLKDGNEITLEKDF